MDEGDSDLDYFHENWDDLSIINGNEITLLKDFLGKCLGEHNGGLLFIGCGKEDGRSLVLKCQDGHCYRRIAETGNNENDWEWIGDILDDETRLSL